MPSSPSNPYDELAALADPDPTAVPPEWPDADAVTQEIPVPHQDTGGNSPGPEPESSVLPPPRTYAEVGDDSWSPPDHHRRRPGKGRRARRSRRRRRRGPFSAIPRALKFLVAFLFCAGFLVLADRCAVMYAEKKAQQEVQKELHLAAAPQVDIHGFPFLTQVLDKRLERVDVTVPHVAADRISLAKVRASASDIRLTGNLPRDIRGAVIGNLDGEVELSFDDMNRELAASEVKFSRQDDNSVTADGGLTIAGQEVRVRARAQVRIVSSSELSTDIDDMSVDVPGIATYRPGKGKGLVLHRETAERISRDAARVKALLSVPAVVERLGIPEDDIALALEDEEKLHELTGAPRFVERLTRVNLVDVVVDNPWLLERIGVDPKLITGLTQLRPPELSDRLSFSFKLPKEARDLQLRGVKVGEDGIKASLSGAELAVGRT
ncbi:LmeA family phospholipid-binding protein [Streptomyces sp. NPDC002537]